MKDLIRALKDRIKDKVPAFKEVAVFNNQYEAMLDQQQAAFPFPNCYIEIEPFEWVERLDGIQFADLRLNFHVGVESYTEQGDEYIFELLEKLNLALQRYSIENCFSGLHRADEIPDVNHPNFIVWQVTYKTRYFDASGWRNADKLEYSHDDNNTELEVQRPDIVDPDEI